MFMNVKLDGLSAQKEEERKRAIYDEFVDRTDRKSLHFQIQKYIHTAKGCYQERLKGKRERLRILLSIEDNAYEEEFINKLKTQVDDSVKKRKESLMALKTQKAKEVEEFVQKKKIQQYMCNCDEIRLKLRNKLLRESKEVQLIQIEENCQKEQLRREEDRLWLEVARRITEEQDKAQKYENCLKQRLRETDNVILQKQIQYQKDLQEQEKLEDIELRRRNQELLKAELEGFAAQEARKREEKQRAAQLLRDQLEEQIRQKNVLIEQEKHFDKLFTEEIARQKEAEEEFMRIKLSKMKQSTLLYLQYLHELKKENAAQQKHKEEVLQSYQRKTECEKLRKIQALKLKKENEAKEAHRVLLKQICDNEERKAREIQAEFGSALVYREIFARQVREDREKELRKLQQTKDYRKELLKQIQEIRCFEAEEKRRFEEDLRKAALEEDHCIALAKKYIEENIDYLPAHPNWRNISCPCIKKN